MALVHITVDDAVTNEQIDVIQNISRFIISTNVDLSTFNVDVTFIPLRDSFVPLKNVRFIGKVKCTDETHDIELYCSSAFSIDPLVGHMILNNKIIFCLNSLTAYSIPRNIVFTFNLSTLNEALERDTITVLCPWFFCTFLQFIEFYDGKFNMVFMHSNNNILNFSYNTKNIHDIAYTKQLFKNMNHEIIKNRLSSTESIEELDLYDTQIAIFRNMPNLINALRNKYG